MARAFFFFATLATLSACDGDNNQPSDAGNDAGTDVVVSDASVSDGSGSDGSVFDGSAPDAPVDAKTDAPKGTCVFGTSQFDDGCTFGP
jgi:hypothetical protein